ncbi:MAG: D-alanine--D-alanine ligase [Magnetococcales bacterium]|nr:D-alanine--D-alanine ligase [Magnetococcales bacterium]
MNDLQKRRIAVLMGGPSEEREVSLKSGGAMLAALQRKGYDAIGIDVDRQLPKQLIDEKIDAVLLALHGPLGEDGSVQGLLETMGIPYTGSNVCASALCMDKLLTKRIFRDGGIHTPDWCELSIANESEIPQSVASLPNWEPPLYVKPSRSGSSVGVVRVEDRSELEHAVREGWNAVTQSPSHGRGQPVHFLVEQAVTGTETALAILDGEPLPTIEIQPLSGFYDYRNKYTAGRTRYLMPPESLSSDAENALRRVGVDAYHLLGCRGLARVDIIIDSKETPWVLEVNTIPGMTETSLAPKAAAQHGLKFEDLVERILAGASLTSWDQR